MSDEKTSQLIEASLPLDGSEIVGIVQSGANVQTTTSAIANIPFNNESIAIGLRSYASPAPFNIAIGYYANAPQGFGVAIGQYTNLTGFGAVAIGYNARANYNATAIGSNATADVNTVAVGAGTVAHEAHSVAIGVAAYAQYGSTTIGYNASCRGHYSVAIGMYASAAFSTNRAVAIGHGAMTIDNLAVAVGYRSEAALVGVSIGHEAGLGYAVEGCVAIGAHTANGGYNSTAVGCYTHTIGTGAVALGGYSYANSGGTALGASSYANASSVAIGNMARAVGFYSVAIGPGAITNNSGSVVFGFGAQDRMAGEFVINGFPAFGAPMFGVDRYQKLVGATTGVSTSVVMTSDGNPTSPFNVPAINGGAITTMTARVTGANTNWLTGGDIATFVLDAPALIMRDSGGIYTFVNEPTFVLENSTDGATGWTVPTLTLNGDSNQLYLTAIQSGDTNINWMAHLKCEGSG